MMNQLKKLAHVLAALGPWGIFLAAVLDSLVPLPTAVDTLVMVSAYGGRPVSAALAAAAGSLLGTLALYGLGRGGRRLGSGGETRARALPRWLEGKDFLAVFVAGLLPPPFPFKAVVFPAGVLRVSVKRFVAAVAISRALRYGIEAALAVRYGAQVMDILKAHYPVVAAGLLALALVAALAMKWWRPATLAQPVSPSA